MTRSIITQLIPFLCLLLLPAYGAAAPAPFPKPVRVCHKHFLYGNWIEDKDTYEFFKRVAFAKPTAKHAVLRLAERLDEDPTNAWTFRVTLDDLTNWALNQPLNVTVIGMPPYYADNYTSGSGTFELTNDEPRKLIVRWRIKGDRVADIWSKVELVKGVPAAEKEMQSSVETCDTTELCATEAPLDATAVASVSNYDLLSVPLEESADFCVTEYIWEEAPSAESSPDSSEQYPADEQLLDPASSPVLEHSVEEYIDEADFTVADPADPTIDTEVSEPYPAYQLPTSSPMRF